jgi:hypothetical protein
VSYRHTSFLKKIAERIKKKTGDSVLVQSKDTETIYFNSIRIIKKHFRSLRVKPWPLYRGYRYMVCPAISSYSFGATALILCLMFIHIMEVCMSTEF